MKRTYSLIILVLSFSLFVYLFYRTEKTLVNEICMLFLSFETYTQWKAHITQFIPLGKPVIYSLPGGLWVFCATLLAKDFYVKIGGQMIQAFLIPILFAVGLELLQLIHFANGRFDFWDLGAYGLFWILAIYLFKREEEKQNLISPFTLNGFICMACFLIVYLAHVCQ